MILPIILVFSAYGGAWYSAVLFRGWNITLNEAFNPLAGFSWGTAVQCIPDTQVLPGGAGSECGGSASSPGGTNCASLSISKIESIILNPIAEAKYAECIAGKAPSEIAQIGKDIWGFIRGHGKSTPAPPGSHSVGVK